jgi:FkbM family methyltransferase
VEIDWLELWRELVVANLHTLDSAPTKRYEAHSYRKKQRPDPLLDCVVQSIDASMTILDIGAGNGRWTIPLARKAKSVTAIEPDADMLNELRENIKTGSGNIQNIQSSWEDAEVEVHDIAVCAHAMYSSPDHRIHIRLAHLQDLLHPFQVQQYLVFDFLLFRLRHGIIEYSIF